MRNFEKTYKKLYKYHVKEITKANSANYNLCNNLQTFNVEYIIACMKLKRDYLILTTDFDKLETSKNLQTVSAIIDEYDLYNDCINNYYTIVNGVPSAIDKTKSVEETQKLYELEKIYHWNFFWELLKIYTEGLPEDDLTI